MTDYSTLSADYLAGLARQPAARPAASIGEVWSAEWKRAGLETLTGLGQPLDDAYGELTRAVESATGKPVTDFAPGLADAASTDERAALIRAQVAALPEDQRRPIDPLLDVRRRASEIALKTEKDANEIYSATYGLSGVATAWAAGIARQAVDPVNLAALPFGGPLKGGIVKMLLREATVGGITQGIQEPAIEAGRAELGLEAGFGRAAGNIAGAAIGAAGMAGLFRVGSAALRLARGERPGVTDAISEGVPVSEPSREPMIAPTDSALSRAAAPEDLAAAARVVERDQLVDAVSPAQDPAGLAAHAQGVHDAGAAIEAGRDVTGVPLNTVSPEGFTRFYHGGLDPTSGGPRWLTPNFEYARDFRRDGAPNEVHYVDIPNDSPLLKKSFDDTGSDVKSPFVSFEAPEEIAKKLKPVPDLRSPEITRLEDMAVPESLRGEAPPKPEAPQVPDEERAGLANSDQQISEAPKALGDPVLAKEFERVLAEAGDLEIHVGDRKLKASAALAEAERDAAAARELTDCIGASA